MSSVKLRTSLLPNEADSTAPLPAKMQRDLNAALLESGGMKSVEAALAHELAASGWTTNVRTYVQMLLRSGECTTFDQVMARVGRAVGLDADAEKDKREVNGETNGAATAHPVRDMEKDGSLRIPEKVVVEAAKVARKELEQVCELVVDDV